MRGAGAHTRPWVAGVFGLSALLSCSPEYLVDPRRGGGNSPSDGGAPGSALSIQSVEPKSGPADLVSATRVTVRGTGFDQNVNVIFANDRVCNFKQVVSPTEIICTVPLNEVAGPVPVAVERGGERSTLRYPFRYFYPITNFSSARWERNLVAKPALVLAQDMNQDGFPDAVIAKEGGAALAVILLGPPSTRDGLITSQTVATYPIATSPDRRARDLTIAHLFRTAGFFPSVVYAFDQQVTVFSPKAPGKPLGDESSGFVALQLPSDCPTLIGCRVASVALPAAAGAAGDGLVVSENGKLALYYWIPGAGTADPPRIQGRLLEDLPSSALSITADDFTGDGKADLAVLESKGKVMLYRGLDEAPYFELLESYPAQPNALASLSADLDLDGRVDLVALSTDLDNSLLPYFGGATKLEPSALVTELGGMSALGFAAGEWNGDGYPDLAFVDNSSGPAGKYGLVLGSGERAAGRPVFRTASLQPLPGPHRSIAMADVNNDGLADLLIPDNDGKSVSIYVNTSGPPPRK